MADSPAPGVTSRRDGARRQLQPLVEPQPSQT
ncbi:hypothetical protein ACTIVE_2885 [Actinomadura verrucosospora]|uniref:Uncharacterized protein n=1 Tax=Actinomadura verrucosospora TaxID=46165 RepID=A0A7D4A5F9_ACTVE|nr:hypothetical protein ACTIVE_2885 [Actinomadura verrucosospora]